MLVDKKTLSAAHGASQVVSEGCPTVLVGARGVQVCR